VRRGVLRAKVDGEARHLGGHQRLGRRSARAEGRRRGAACRAECRGRGGERGAGLLLREGREALVLPLLQVVDAAAAGRKGRGGYRSGRRLGSDVCKCCGSYNFLVQQPTTHRCTSTDLQAKRHSGSNSYRSRKCAAAAHPNDDENHRCASTRAPMHA
jgi:hypothetical protein